MSETTPDVLTPFAVTTGQLTKVPVYAYIQAQAYGSLAYAPADAESIMVAAGYIKEGVQCMVFDPREPQPPNTQLMMLFKSSSPVKVQVFLLPEGQGKQAYIAQLAGQGWSYQMDVGYTYGPNTSVPEQDSMKLHLMTHGTQYMYVLDWMVGSTQQEGFTDQGPVAQVMPVYRVACLFDRTTNKITLHPNPANDRDDPQSFFVGSGAGNLIQFNRLDSTWTISNIQFDPPSPQTLAIVLFNDDQVLVRDDNLNVSGSNQSYSFTVYGRDSNGRPIQSDPKIINRTGHN